MGVFLQKKGESWDNHVWTGLARNVVFSPGYLHVSPGNHLSSRYSHHGAMHGPPGIKIHLFITYFKAWGIIRPWLWRQKKSHPAFVNDGKNMLLLVRLLSVRIERFMQSRGKALVCFFGLISFTVKFLTQVWRTDQILNRVPPELEVGFVSSDTQQVCSVGCAGGFCFHLWRTSEHNFTFTSAFSAAQLSGLFHRFRKRSKFQTCTNTREIGWNMWLCRLGASLEIQNPV